MTGRRWMQVTALLTQTGILAACVGRLAIFTLPGQVLLVLVATLVALTAAARRQPTLLVVSGLLAATTASSAALPTLVLLLLGTSIVIQLAVTDAPGSLSVGPTVGVVLLATAASGGLAVVVVTAPRPAAWVTTLGVVTVAVVGLVVAVVGRRQGTTADVDLA